MLRVNIGESPPVTEIAEPLSTLSSLRTGSWAGSGGLHASKGPRRDVRSVLGVLNVGAVHINVPVLSCLFRSPCLVV